MCRPPMCLYIFIVVHLITSTYCLKYSSVDTLYQNGLKAYSQERWSECIEQFEKALYVYKLYSSVLINCRLKCSSQQYDSSLKENIEDLKIYEKFFKAKNCLTDCQDKEFNSLNLFSDIKDSTLEKMLLKKPYEYLHICYFQMNVLPKAASAAYTFLVANPDNQQMKNNLNYYMQQNEVHKNEVVDLETEDYKVLYNVGVRSYNKGNWGETVAAMEEVLTDYFLSENRCRVDCEQLPEQQWSSEFIVTTSNNIASLLQCRQHCQDKLKQLDFHSGIEFLADVINYLQISYYHLGKIGDAAQAVASFLVIKPTDEDMLVNKDIYSELAKKDAFVVRSDIEYYVKRDVYEKMLLDIFHQENGYQLNDNSI